MQCAEFSIPDDSYPQGERSFNISIGDDAYTFGNDDNEVGDGRRVGRSGGGDSIRTDPRSISVTVDIDIDIKDSKS